jgi:hypothetical protein
MAGEWIKIENITPDKPEVLRLARLLGVDRDLILGKLVRLWTWFDRNSVDGVVDGVVSTDVDELVRLPGFMRELKHVGWCDYDDANERVTLANFDEHNGETAKKRAQKNRRQAKWRAGGAADDDAIAQDDNVDDGASTEASTEASTREKKSREKKSKSNPSESKTRSAQFAMHKLWDPSPQVILSLLEQGVPPFLISESLPPFILYWTDINELRCAKAWDTTYIAWVKTKAGDLGLTLKAVEGSR